MNIYIKLWFTLFLMGVPYFGCAEFGTAIPCPDCEQNFTKPIPYEGSWYNPEQSGSGFIFDIQNDRLLGFYFGYDETGDADWALFSGQLQDASEMGALWKVNATLEKFNGGACLNCEYVAPEQNETLGEIEVVFNRLAHASFSVNGGDVQNIVPLYFGYPANAYFHEQTRFATPELQGWWSVYIIEASPISRPEPYRYMNFMIHVNKGRTTNEGNLLFSSSFYSSSPEIVRIGDIECKIEVINDEEQPTCLFSMVAVGIGFKINLGNISAERLYGESIEGDTLEMIRVSSDFCTTPATPENCVNTGVFDYLND